MRAAYDLLSSLHTRGVQFWVENDQIHYSLGDAELSQEDLKQLSEHRDELLRMLKKAQPTETVVASIVPVPRGSLIPVSFSQQRLWFLSQMEEASAAYHVPLGLRLRGALDEAALVRTLDRLVWRHEVLRTTFVSVDGEPMQRIGPAEQGFALERQDLSAQAEAALDMLALEEACAAFDLERGPLIRGRLVRMGADDHVLLITLHHIVSDGWSIAVLTRELSTLYQAYAAGGEDPLAPLEVQYADYAAWQRRWLSGEALAEQSAYWRKTLSGAPPFLDLPTDRRRPARQDYSGGSVGLGLDEALTAQLKALSRRHGMTLFMTVLTGWALVLSRLSGQDEVVIGTPSANRTRSEVEGLIGFFVNTLALRVDLSGDPTVGELLERVRASALGAQSNQDLPFEQVVELVRPARSLAHTPIFQALFSWQNNERGGFDLAGVQIETRRIPREVAQFDLVLNAWERNGRILGELDYATALFDRETVERFCGYLRGALTAMAHTPDASAARLDILPPEERAQLLVSWNDTAQAYPEERCIHELFEAQALRDPEATAVVLGESSLSYGELNARANRLAHRLRSLGVGPDVRVAICVERSLEMVVGMLGILKAGGAYVPLDPGYPTARLATMLQDSGAPILLTKSDLEERLPQHRGHTIYLDEADARTLAQASTQNLPPSALGLTPRHLAYVIYTSGSTGTPKGVMVEHRNLVNYLSWAVEAYRLVPGGETPVNTSFAFDATATSLLAPLSAGGTVRLLAENDTELVQLGELLETHRGISLVKLTPAHLDALRPLRPDAARPGAAGALVIGGEALQARQVELWRERAPDVRLINEYGPTETTVGVAVYEVGPETTRYDAVPIGRPIANARIYVLDRFLQPVPVGVAGELWIGGAGVARGYLNRPELTAERFVDSPFVRGDRLYRTGDLGRWRADGNLEFLGRNDFQVKLRGFRIELGEIEAKLSEHPGVRAAVVLAREDSPGDRRLVVYYTSAAEEVLEAEALRAHLAASLPEHMVPAAYVWLDALPLTPNGKLDRAALPAPDGAAYAVSTYEPPQGDVEEAVARIWAEVLGLERVGRHDNFFDLGGHSLLAVRVLERMRQAGLKADIRVLFESADLHALAGAAEPETSSFTIPPNLIPEGCERITPDLLPLVELKQQEIDRIAFTVVGGAANIQDIYPLAPLQEGILLHHLMAEAGDPYLGWTLFSFANRERLDAYLRAVGAVIARHDILRTAVVWDGLPHPVQVVWRQASPVVEEIELDPENGDVAEQLKAICDPRRRSIDLQAAPLIRFFVAKDPSTSSWLMISLVHHLIEDNLSLQLFIREVGLILGGQSHKLVESYPFREFVARAKHEASGEEHKRFFQDLLRDVQEPTAPFELLDVQGDGAKVTEAGLTLLPELAARIRAAARGLGVGSASVFHAAWAQVVSRAAGRDDPVFGTVLLGRTLARDGADRAVGLFINMLPFRLNLNGTVEQTVRGAHRLLGELLHREHAPLLTAVQASGIPPKTPLFTCFMNYRRRLEEGEGDEAGSAFAGMELIDSEERTNYPLLINVDDLGPEFRVTLQAAEPVHPLRVARMMLRAVEDLVTALECDPRRAMRSIDVLPAEERHRLLVEFNETATDWAADCCAHELFEKQARREPGKTALVWRGETIGYGDLDARANRLARRLQSQGVGPGQIVGLCLERSPDMVVALLAILKAGGAVLPLDPAYPPERLAFMVSDARPSVIITREGLGGVIAADRSQLLLVDRYADQIALESNQPLGRGVSPDDVAYVIYTSGSTGRPKGVMACHAGVLNRCEVQQAIDPYFEGSICAQKAALGFVDCFFETLCPLVHGKTIAIIPYEETLDPVEFVSALNRNHVHHMVTVPSHAAALVRGGVLSGLTQLKSWTLGGEELTPDLLQAIRRELPHCRVINLYGSTEVTDAATICIDPPLAGAKTSIGRPIANARIYVLDRFLQPVPVGVAGELWIGGAGVARGYLNRAELTAERFVDSPFVTDDRLYRTGDLGRWRADGNLEFLGRNDFQVKLRGFRIELGEIEARLLEHADVREAVVVAGDAQGGEKRLVAYYTLAADRDPGAAGLREGLLRNLPEHMVPAAYVRMETLPLNPNGKLDRKSLPSPEGAAYPIRNYEPPANPIEESLAALWSELLNVERVGRRDNFFDLGGHSLLAPRILSGIRERLGRPVPLRWVFEAPVLADFSAKVAREKPAQQQFKTSDGLAITFHRWGPESAHPPILLHHGFATNATFDWLFTGVVSALVEAGRHVIALDARGHGESDKPHTAADYGFRRSSQDVCELLDVLKLEQADIVGFSMGAVVAMHTAARDRRVRKLVLIGVGDSLLEGSTRKVGDESSPGGTGLGRFASLAEQTGADHLALQAHLGAAQDMVPVKALVVPTLLIAGDRDPWAAGADCLAEALQSARLAVVPGTHETTLRSPMLRRELLAFLEEEPTQSIAAARAMRPRRMSQAAPAGRK